MLARGGLGLAALVSGGGRVSHWSAVVAVWSFRVERGGGRRWTAVEGGFLYLRVGESGERLASIVNMGVA